MAGRKRPAEDRVDRDGQPASSSGASPGAARTVTPGASTLVRPITMGGSSAVSPFAQLAAGGDTAAAPKAGFGGANFGLKTFGFGVAATADKESAPAPAAAAAAPTPSFSFGSAPAAPAPSADHPKKFTFNFSTTAAATPAAAASSSADAAPAPTNGSSASGGAPQFKFGGTFDFNKGVQNFTAAQTALATAPKADEDPEAEVSTVDKLPPVPKNALAAAAVQEERSGLETDRVVYEVSNTKVVALEKEWKERGIGDLKLCVYTDATGAEKHRLVMHSAQTKRLVININLDNVFAVTEVAEKYVKVRTAVMVDGTPKPQLFILRVAESAAAPLGDAIKAALPK